MPNTPEFASIVPSGWTLDTLIDLVKLNRDNVIISEDGSGELTLSIGYKERDDGALIKIR